MKALTLHQPWSSLVAIGVKTVETRSWGTTYRGPLAIHAALRRPDVEMVEDGQCGEIWDEDSGDCLVQWGPTDPRDYFPGPAPPANERWWLSNAPDFPFSPMPLGAIVATCTLVDVLPMVEAIPIGEFTKEDRVVQIGSDGRLCVLDRWKGGGEVVAHLNDQRPYGVFAVGRFAWVLADVVSTCIPAKGRQGLWNWSVPHD